MLSAMWRRRRGDLSAHPFSRSRCGRAAYPRRWRTGNEHPGPAMPSPDVTAAVAALPITQRADEVVAAIRDHQVVVVAGETGSGKSTQLPKLCLAAGRGTEKLIGHTQPRRLAARTIAERVAEELDTTV